MGLSEREEQILAELEHQLAADDPRLARRVTKLAERSSGRRLAAAIGLFVVGFGLMLALTFHIAFGVVGAALVLTSIVTGARAAGELAMQRVADRPADVQDRQD